MATVEIPTRVCHKCGTKKAGASATIGNSCYSNPLWNASGCIDWDLDLVACNPQSLTLTSVQTVELPLAPEREEPPVVV